MKNRLKVETILIYSLYEMYHILCSKAVSYLQGKLAVSSACVNYNNGEPLIDYNDGWINHKLYIIILSKGIKCPDTELFSNIFQIYGINMWQKDKLYYNDHLGVTKVLSLQIGLEMYYNTYNLNGFLLERTLYDGLLFLLLDPLHFIKLISNKPICAEAECFFDTLKCAIQKQENNTIMKYLLLSQLYVTEVFVMDIVHVVVDRYIWLLKSG